MKRLLLPLITAPLLLAGLSVEAQRSGQSITITQGIVTGAQAVQVSSNAPGGALVGGTLGYAMSGGKSSSRKRKNAALGAIAGGAVSGASQGSRAAMEYTVTTPTGAVKIISDQTQIAVGDCVMVENAGSNQGNIRRADASVCEEASREVVASEEMQQEFQEEAAECLKAKQELADAQDDAAFDRAVRKVDILCNT